MAGDFSTLPIIDIGDSMHDASGRAGVADQIRRACRESGFFYIVGHNVDERLQQQLEDVSRTFFARSLAEKLDVSMEKGGRAWRGYFPVGGELTSGRPDLKEGLYFGAELDADDPLVRSATPMHGPNLFPGNIPLLRETVLEYMAAMTSLGRALMELLALSLGLEASYFAERYTSDPLILFRIFNYPPDAAPVSEEQNWGVGAHTDYGLLTILKQDRTGGLAGQVERWLD